MNISKTFNGAFIFNFFPRPVTPDLNAVLKYWATAGNSIANFHKEKGELDIYISTHLHMSTNPNSTYQLFNFGVFKNFDAFPFMITKKPEVVMALMGKNKPITRALPGGYVEFHGLQRGGDEAITAKKTPDDTRYIVSVFTFGDDVPTAPGPPPSKFCDATHAAITEFDSDWADVSGANHLVSKDSESILSSVHLYKRETHGLVAYVLRAIIPGGAALEDKAGVLISDLKAFYSANDFLKGKKVSTDVDLYRVIINGGMDGYEPNEFGIVNE